MSPQRKVLYLLLSMAAAFFTPLIGLYVIQGKIPENYFHFPATDAPEKAGPNTVAIVITCLFWLAYLLLIFFPRIYGFKKVEHTLVQAETKAQISSNGFPLWFWIGLFLWGGVMLVFLAKISSPKPLVDWALVPLWWGFVLMLDGVVYKRNSGRSLVRNAPTELFAMGVLSISGWMIFEYFNFFIEVNWFYPFADLIPDHGTFLLYALVGSSAFIPMAFEWYHLLRTIPFFNRKYRRGPRANWPLPVKVILFLLSFCALFFLNDNSESLFYAIWLAPMIILITVMGWLGMWTPFTPIKQKGDWTVLVVFSLTWLLQGFFIEWWNHLSYQHHFVGTSNPGYWNYKLPYVHFYCVFNMPILGYLGYVPFSIYCCIWFIAVSYLMNIQNKFSFDHP
ncbi:MAG: hypothetical protein EOO01_00880 [Chitinophagaceae bacterium]|nr:MAG: hypothetical protein EOO01_00880 [Chitinophagaceae bacterium]